MSAWKRMRWIPVSICVAVGGAAAFAKVDGWGWFLFVAILFAIDW